MLTVLRLNQVAVSPRGVAIANNNVSRQVFSIGQLNALGTAALHTNARHGCVVTNGDLALIEQLHQFAHNRAGAAHG